MKINAWFAAWGILASLPEVQAKASLDKSIASLWDDFKNAVDCGSCQVNKAIAQLVVKY